LHGWLRSGNTGAARGVVAFLQEALALLPEGMWVRCVRADSGFFEEALLQFLEARQLSYIVVARLTRSLKQRCAGIKHWTPIDELNDFHFKFRAQMPHPLGECRAGIAAIEWCPWIKENVLGVTATV
jgi:hypothetical protein